jgi:hypothetical protein
MLIPEATGGDEESITAAAPTSLSNPSGNGRDPATGRFIVGYRGGPGGNPLARRAARIRSILFECATDDRTRAVCNKLIDKAIAGDNACIKLFLEYHLGAPEALDLVHQVARLQAAILRGAASVANEE